VTDTDVPFPIPDEVTAPFWNGIGRGVLLLQQCTDCGRFIFYPRPICPHCMGTRLEWQTTSGSGTVYAFSIVHRAPPSFKATPYVVALVDLKEGVRMMTRLLVDDPATVEIGKPVQLRIAGEPPLPFFDLTSTDDESY
jgi:uncharacterized OB-fold protein